MALGVAVRVNRVSADELHTGTRLTRERHFGVAASDTRIAGQKLEVRVI